MYVTWAKQNLITAGWLIHRWGDWLEIKNVYTEDTGKGLLWCIDVLDTNAHYGKTERVVWKYKYDENEEYIAVEVTPELHSRIITAMSMEDMNFHRAVTEAIEVLHLEGKL